jgi:AcrR family transcriptional regulator
MPSTPNDGPVRRRDLVLNAAIELFRSRGFHGVGIDDIGAGAGITGPGIYRHFANKNALLIAIFDRVLDELSAGAGRILSKSPDDLDALRSLVEFHATFVLTDRSIISVYHQEQRNLPEPDRRRIRRRQRAYLHQWVTLLTNLRPAMSDAEALALVHAAIGVLASPTTYESTLERERLHRVLVERAVLVLCGAPC